MRGNTDQHNQTEAASSELEIEHRMNEGDDSPPINSNSTNKLQGNSSHKPLTMSYNERLTHPPTPTTDPTSHQQNKSRNS